MLQTLSVKPVGLTHPHSQTLALRVTQPALAPQQQPTIGSQPRTTGHPEAHPPALINTPRAQRCPQVRGLWDGRSHPEGEIWSIIILSGLSSTLL